LLVFIQPPLVKDHKNFVQRKIKYEFDKGAKRVKHIEYK